MGTAARPTYIQSAEPKPTLLLRPTTLSEPLSNRHLHFHAVGSYRSLAMTQGFKYESGMVKMKYLVAVLCGLLLAACGGGEAPAVAVNTPLPFRLASPVSGDPEVALHLYQALYGKAPSYPHLNTFKSQIAANGAVAWANSTAASFTNLSNSEFAALVLNNVSITPTSLTATAHYGTPQQAYDGLLAGFIEYLNFVGIAHRGVVAAQLSEIISNLEVDTQFGVYGPAALAFNKQTNANLLYAQDPANQVDATVPPSVCVTPAVADVTKCLVPLNITEFSQGLTTLSVAFRLAQVSMTLQLVQTETSGLPNAASIRLAASRSESPRVSWRQFS